LALGARLALAGPPLLGRLWEGAVGGSVQESAIPRCS
jgi:hypothetical protein